MQIHLTNIGKRFNKDWIFRRVNYHFQSGKSYAITGPNGSGKSTLLQIIAASVMHNEGTIDYEEKGTPVNPLTVFSKVAMVAPYIELIEEMTPIEFLHFHQQMKGFVGSLSIREILESIQLDHARNKQIRYFSSGMKQRMKLGQAFFSDTPLLLLDEPLTNLDEAGIALYASLIENVNPDRLIIVSSNDPKEYSFCNEVISLNDFK